MKSTESLHVTCGISCDGMVFHAFKSTIMTSGVPRGGFGVFKPPPPKFRRYRWSPWPHEQEEPASRFPFVVHCVLIRL